MTKTRILIGWIMKRQQRTRVKEVGDGFRGVENRLEPSVEHEKKKRERGKKAGHGLLSVGQPTVTPKGSLLTFILSCPPQPPTIRNKQQKQIFDI